MICSVAGMFTNLELNDGAEPAARFRFSDEAVSWVRWVHHYPVSPLPGFGIIQNTHRFLFLACEPAGCMHDAFHSVFGVGRGCGVPHSDGGGEDTQW